MPESAEYFAQTRPLSIFPAGAHRQGALWLWLRPSVFYFVIEICRMQEDYPLPSYGWQASSLSPSVISDCRARFASSARRCDGLLSILRIAADDCA